MSIQIIDRDQGTNYDIYRNGIKEAVISIDNESKIYKIRKLSGCKLSSSMLSKIARNMIPYDYRESGKDHDVPLESEPRSTESESVVVPSTKGCEYVITIEPKTSRILKSLSKDVFFMDSKGKKKVGKEFFGNMNMIPQSDGRIVLVYNEDGVITGTKDRIDGFEDKVTYHTHPYPTYIEFDAKYAWPSKLDYKSIADTIIHGKGVFHIVVTVEGIYIVSLNDNWCSQIDTLKKMIKKEDKKYEMYMSKLDIEYPYKIKNKKTNTPHISTPHEFCKYANKQGIDEKPVLKTQYVPWKDKMEFRIRSPIIGSVCKM